MSGVAPPKVTVFIDYQNAHLSAHEQWCSYKEPAHLCLIHPLRLAERTVKKRAPGGVLEAVYVYRGRPEPRREPASAGRSDKQAAAWSRPANPLVKVIRRTLWYPRDYGKPGCVEAPREKGIDVSLAIDVVRMAMEKQYEVGIVFSRDTDLLPAIELAYDLPDTHLEVATWTGASRLRLKYSMPVNMTPILSAERSQVQDHKMCRVSSVGRQWLVGEPTPAGLLDQDAHPVGVVHSER